MLTQGRQRLSGAFGLICLSRGLSIAAAGPIAGQLGVGWGGREREREGGRRERDNVNEGLEDGGRGDKER